MDIRLYFQGKPCEVSRLRDCRERTEVSLGNSYFLYAFVVKILKKVQVSWMIVQKTKQPFFLTCVYISVDSLLRETDKLHTAVQCGYFCKAELLQTLGSWGACHYQKHLICTALFVSYLFFKKKKNCMCISVLFLEFGFCLKMDVFTALLFWAR